MSPPTVNVPVLTGMPANPASQPPRNAPRTPTTRSHRSPMPLPVSTLLAAKPAISPTMIQMTIPNLFLYLCSRLAAVVRTGGRDRRRILVVGHLATDSRCTRHEALQLPSLRDG